MRRSRRCLRPGEKQRDVQVHRRAGRPLFSLMVGDLLSCGTAAKSQAAPLRVHRPMSRSRAFPCGSGPLGEHAILDPSFSLLGWHAAAVSFLTAGVRCSRAAPAQAFIRRRALSTARRAIGVIYCPTVAMTASLEKPRMAERVRLRESCRHAARHVFLQVTFGRSRRPPLFSHGGMATQDAPSQAQTCVESYVEYRIPFQHRLEANL